MNARPRRMPAARDPAEAVARVALSKRDLLLRVHARRLRREDLEDCFSQAMLELVQRARNGSPFESDVHLANSLEQKFLSRIRDRHRAVAGRSAIEAAYAGAASLEDPTSGVGELRDLGADVEDLTAGRLDIARLREIAEELSPDQRLAIASQVGLQMSSGEFCRRHGWTAEKFRKVAQRGRARLRALAFEYATGERCRRLAPDLSAWCEGSLRGDREAGILTHLANCTACRRVARERVVPARRRRGRDIAAALWPGPVGGFAHALHSLLAGRAARATASAHGGGGALAAGAAGSGAAAPSLLGLGGVKLGISALCVAGLAGGGLAVCDRAPPRAHPTASAHHRHPASHHTQASGGSAGVAAVWPMKPGTHSAHAGVARGVAGRRAATGGGAVREFGLAALAPAPAGRQRPGALTAARRATTRAGFMQGAPAVRRAVSGRPRAGATFERRPSSAGPPHPP